MKDYHTINTLFTHATYTYKSKIKFKQKGIK